MLLHSDVLAMYLKLFVVSVTLLAAVLIAPAHGTLLKAEIEHSDTLQPVKDNLAPGELFDKGNLPQLADPIDANRWYPVPAWLAGKWHKDDQTDFYRYDYRNKQTDTTTRVQEARSDGVWGTQRDQSGQTWQFDPAPFITTVDAGDQMVVQIVRLSEPVEDTPQRFVRRSIDTQIRVDKESNVIKTVESGEQITQYIPESDGLVKRETSAKVFDRLGQPLVLGKSFSYEKRIAPFAPENFYKGKDMRELFQQFLAGQNEGAQAGGR